MAAGRSTPVYIVPPKVNIEGHHRIGDYELLELIGKGGMGRVFKARQISLNRVVALKILPADLAQNHTYTLRFVREARASGMLKHPNIVQGIDCGQDDPSGLWYFAMEYIDGQPLSDELLRSGALPEERVIEIGMAMASALGEAARHGIVHRDIKPENILVSTAGEIKLADLGVAKFSAQDDAALTRTEDMVGTPYYVSPEQARGQRDQIDTRSDIYSLGATLFHLATGQPPFEGESCADIMVRHIQDRVPLAYQVEPDVSEALSRVIAKMMQKAQHLRYQKPNEVRDALDRARLGVFVGRGETTRLATVASRRATAARARHSSSRLVVPRRYGAVPPSGAEPASKRYVLIGSVAIMVSLAALVGFLVLDAAKPTVGQDRAASNSRPLPPVHVLTKGNPALPPHAPEPAKHAEPQKTPQATIAAMKEAGAPVPTTTAPDPATGHTPVPGLDGWFYRDLGSVSVPGKVAVKGNTITLHAAGKDIWEKQDSGFVIYRCLRGDGSLTVRVKSIEKIDQWSKGGVMFRESLHPGARHAYACDSAGKPVAISWRKKMRNLSFSEHGPEIEGPVWVRLTRKGDNFTGYFSRDGSAWTLIGITTVPMKRDVYACLAATSHLEGTTAAMVVEHLTFQGTSTPPDEWPPALPASGPPQP